MRADLNPCLRCDSEDRSLPDSEPGLGCDAANLVLRQALVDSLLAGVDVLQHQTSARQHPDTREYSQSTMKYRGGF